MFECKNAFMSACPWLQCVHECVHSEGGTPSVATQASEHLWQLLLFSCGLGAKPGARSNATLTAFCLKRVSTLLRV